MELFQQMPSTTMIVVDYHVQVHNDIEIPSDYILILTPLEAKKKKKQLEFVVFFLFLLLNSSIFTSVFHLILSIASNILDAWFSLYVLMKMYLCIQCSSYHILCFVHPLIFLFVYLLSFSRSRTRSSLSHTHRFFCFFCVLVCCLTVIYCKLADVKS